MNLSSTTALFFLGLIVLSQIISYCNYGIGDYYLTRTLKTASPTTDSIDNVEELNEERTSKESKTFRKLNDTDNTNVKTSNDEQTPKEPNQPRDFSYKLKTTTTSSASTSTNMATLNKILNDIEEKQEQQQTQSTNDKEESNNDETKYFLNDNENSDSVTQQQQQEQSVVSLASSENKDDLKQQEEEQQQPQEPVDSNTNQLTTETENVVQTQQEQQQLSNIDDNNSNNSEIKPKIYAYVGEEEYHDEEMLKVWLDSWKIAGWETSVLNLENAKEHSDYEEFNKKLDDAKICCLPKLTFIRFLAMATINDGGFLSEIYVLPLHKVASGSSSVLPDHGLTYHDGFTGSIISGPQSEYDKLVKLLMANIEKNSSLSQKKIYDLGRESNPTSYYRNTEFLENIRYFNQDVCLRSEEKFFLRLHPNEIMKHNVAYLPSSYRAFMVRNWLDFYRNLCWKDHALNHIVPKEIAFTKIDNNSTTATSLDDNNGAKSYEKPIIHEGTTQTQVTCDVVSCRIKDACIGKNGVIQIFGDEDHVKVQQEKLANKITHAWVCDNCTREVKTERGTSFHNIWADSATMSTGIGHNNCGFHLGDVIWPLVRLNAKFREPQDIVNNGLGYLFLQSPTSHCDSLYTAISQQVERYQTIEDNVCFNNIYVGAYQMNYMITSPNSFFVPYDNFNKDMRLMRALFYNSFGISANSLPKMDTILIMRKRQGRKELRSLQYHNIANIPEIVTMIHTKFPNKYNVQIVSWEDYGVMHQVRIMARTRLMISLPGAATMNAFLFQDEAALLCYCQRDDNVSANSATVFINNIKFQQSNEFKLWFDHFDYGTYTQICQEPDMHLIGSDTILDVDVLEKRMIDLGM